MKVFVKEDKRSEAKKAYDDAMLYLQSLPLGSSLYKEQFEICERLHAMVIEEENHSRKISPDTIATCACSAFGVMVVAYRDYLHPISTKALNFVMKGRVR